MHQILAYQALDSKFCEARDRMQCYFANTNSYNVDRINRSKIERALRNGEKGVYGRIFTKLKKHEKEIFNLNPYEPKIEALVGSMINNFKSMIVEPTDDNLQGTADQWSKTLLKVQQVDSFKNKAIRIFSSGVVSGFDLQFFSVVSDNDFTNRIVSKHIPFCNFYCDNAFTQEDLSDCKYINTWSYLTEDELRYCFPDYTSQMKEALCMCKNNDRAPTDKIAQNRVDEFWYLDYRKAVIVYDNESRMAKEWDGTEEELDYALANNPLWEKRENFITTIRLSIAVNNIIFYDDWNPLKLDRYPFAPFFCNFEPTYTNANRSYGYIHNLMGAGFFGSRAYTLYWKNLEKLVYPPKIYKPSSLVKSEEAQDPNLERGISVKKEGAINDFSYITTPDITSSLSNFITAMNQELQNTSGMNDAMLGSSDDDSGIKMLFRQGAGLNIHASIFHNFDMFMKQSGEIMYELVRLHYSPEKIETMIQEPVSDDFFSKLFGEYRIEIVPGLNTTNQQAIQTEQLVKLSRFVPIDPMDILQVAPLQDKARIMRNAEERAKQKQEQDQIAAQIDLQKEQSIIDLRRAETNSLDTNAEYNLAKADERYSKAEENVTSSVKNITAAEKDQAATYENFAKMMSDVTYNFNVISQLIQRIQNQIGGIYGNEKRQSQNISNQRTQELLSGSAQAANGEQNNEAQAAQSMGYLL